jgi:3-methyladenine DNA glycosylase AlkD
MKTATPHPRKIAAEYIVRLKELADPVKAAGAERYFKEKARFLGISSPALRALSQDVYQKVRPEWGTGEVICFCAIMLQNPYHEVRALGILTLERYRKELPIAALSTMEGWLEADRCDSWALVDLLCPKTVGTLIERYPNIARVVRDWAKSPNRWVRRASIVSFLKLTRYPRHIEAIYDLSRKHFDDSDDLIQKANGWLLREAGKTDMTRLERFLRRFGPSIPRTTLRYAIERFPEAKRKSLLLATKKP